MFQYLSHGACVLWFTDVTSLADTGPCRHLHVGKKKVAYRNRFPSVWNCKKSLQGFWIETLFWGVTLPAERIGEFERPISPTPNVSHPISNSCPECWTAGSNNNHMRPLKMRYRILSSHWLNREVSHDLTWFSFDFLSLHQITFMAISCLMSLILQQKKPAEIFCWPSAPALSSAFLSG